MNHRFNIMISLIFSFVFCQQLEAKPGSTDRALTKKQAAELNRFNRRSDLVTPLMMAVYGKNQFDQETPNVLKNFDIVQKMPDGYISTPRTPPCAVRELNEISFSIFEN